MNTKLLSMFCLGLLVTNAISFPMESLQLHALSDLPIEKNGKTGFPKWDGLIDLKEAGLPTPNAIFIKPYSMADDIERIVDFFIIQSKTALIGLRPDGKGGVGKSPAGMHFGKSEKPKIINKLMELSAIGHGVTLVETHNRFDYDFCCNIVLNENGDFIIEFVGPGFDGGDLNKAILKPTMTIMNRAKSPIFIYSDPISRHPNLESLERLYFRVNINGRAPTKEEIEIRLKYLMDQLLPDMGIKIERTLSATKKWLKENGCDRLLEGKNLRLLISMDDLQQIIFSASLYAQHLLHSGKNLKAKALTAHKYKGKIVFFGTYDSQKWGNSPQPCSSALLQPSHKECPLCNNGIMLRDNHIKLYRDTTKETNVLLETENFYVIIDNYPVCNDHILIIPKEHFLSYSVVNRQFEYELEAIIKTLSDIVGTQQYGLFEHGSNMVGKEQKGCGNSVYHAHMHFIPSLNILQGDVIDLCSSETSGIVLKPSYKLNDFCTVKKPGQTFLDYLKQLPTKSPYLFCYYSNTNGESLCIPDNIVQSGVPAQFFRRVFAEYFQKGSPSAFWNWKDPNESQRSYGFRAAIIKQTVEKFKDKEKTQRIFQKYLYDQTTH